MPPGGQIWCGWGHLVQPLADLETPDVQTAALADAQRTQELGSYLQVVWELAPKMLLVETRAYAPGPPVVLELFRQLEALAPSKQSFVLLRRFQEVIDAGNRSGRFCVRLPHVPAPMPEEAESPFNHADFEHMVRTLDPLRDAFDASLCDAVDLTADETWGCLLLSATLYGGLTKSAWLLAIPEAVQAADRDADLRWLMLASSRRAQNETPALPRRWSVDPTTRLLLAVFLSRGLPPMPSLSRANSRQVMRLFAAYARRAGFADLLPSRYSDVVRAETTALHESMPAWLVNYATDRYLSASLPAWSWERLLQPPIAVASELTPRPRPGGGDRLPDCAADEESEDGSAEGEGDDRDDEKGDVDRNSGTPESAEESSGDRATGLRELGSVILKGNRGLRHRLQQWRETQRGNLLPSVDLLLEWSIEWLLVSGRGRRPIGARYLYEKINSAGKRIVGQLGGMDLRCFTEASSFVEVYQTVLEDAPAEVRHRVARSLRSLHAFLVARHRAPELPDVGMFVLSGVKGRVDANLVTLDLHIQAQALLASELRVGDEEVDESLQIIGDLGFFAGTRRSEALGVTLGDFVGRHDLWLMLRPNELRGLKTRNCQRDLPLHLLMPREQCERLRRRVLRRWRATHDLSAPLFPDFIRDGRVNDKDPRLHRIVVALRRVADDETLRYHHLRHSFASWFVVRIWIAEGGGHNWLPEWLPDNEHMKWLRATAPPLYRELFGHSPTSRRSLMQLSCLLGHSGVDITLHSYVHLADLLLGIALRRLSPDLPSRTLQQLSGLSASYLDTLSGRLRDAGPGALIDDIANRILRPHDRRKKSSDVGKVAATRSDLQIEAPNDPFARMIYLAEAMNRVLRDGYSVDEVATRFGLDATRLLKCLARRQNLPTGYVVSVPLNAPEDLKGRRFAGVDVPSGEGEESLARGAVETWERLAAQGDPEAGLERGGVIRRLAKVAEIAPRLWQPGSVFEARCDSLPDAKLWCWWLRQLGLGEGMVGWHHPVKSSLTRHQQRRYWATALGMELTGIDRFAPSDIFSARGTVSIDIDLRRVPAAACAFSRPQALYGLRFVLGMSGA